MFRSGPRGEVGEHAVGGEQVRAVLDGELPDGGDLRVQAGAPCAADVVVDEHGAGFAVAVDPGFDDAVDRQEERLDEDDLGARRGQGSEQAVITRRAAGRERTQGCYPPGIARRGLSGRCGVLAGSAVIDYRSYSWADEACCCGRSADLFYETESSVHRDGDLVAGVMEGHKASVAR